MAAMDATLLLYGFAPFLLISATLLGFTSAQEDDFSSPIKCFTCSGSVDNSVCSDPIDVKLTNTSYKMCESGVCLKYTLYAGHKLQMLRGCSSDLNFHLTMIDGVCRTERNGNGYLCMCGKNLCNASPPSPAARGLFLLRNGREPGILMVTALLVVVMIVNNCYTPMYDASSSSVGDLLWNAGVGKVFPVR